MDSSSESDPFEGSRCRGRDAQRRPGRDRTRGGGAGGGDGRSEEISQKISTLANTLQDTSKNLSKVDRMLGRYQENTDGQAEAMVLLRENLEESINQLQKRRLSRSNGGLSASASASASASTLHTSDLDACSGSEERRFVPKDHASPPGRRRRSQSAGVRFKDPGLTTDEVHTLHRSLRDLRSDQLRLSGDLDREIVRRNRCDVDTRRAMESLTDHMTTSHRQDSASSHVERRLRELERETGAEHRSPERERRPPQGRGAASDEPWETFGRSPVQEREEATAAWRRTAEREKSKVEQELERARRLLEQSEESRESLSQQVEDMRGELKRTRKEKAGLQRALLESPPPPPHGEREGGRGARPGPDRSDLEKEVAELRVQLCKASVLGEVGELKRALELKEKERVLLGVQVKELSSELAGREQQQLRMLEQLRDLQTRGQTERRETEALLQESSRSREELRTRAQEAVRQWRAKCRRLQKALEEERAQAGLQSDQASQAARERESAQAQLKALGQQAEAAHRELAQVRGRAAQREDELHRKDVELSESRQRCLSLQQEAREAKEAKAALEEEAQRQSAVQAALRDDKRRLEEEAEVQARRSQRERDVQAELRAELQRAEASSVRLAQRLAAAEESARKELQRDASELGARLRALQEERDALGRQLRLQRDVHAKELGGLRAALEESGVKKEREAREALELCRREREGMEAHLNEVKADTASGKEACAALRTKLDRMKDECDKLAAQLSAKDDAHTLLQRKHQLLKQELEDNVRSGERRRASESDVAQLEEKVLQMEAEREAVLAAMGEELDAACRGLARDGGGDQLQAISQRPGLVKDPHRWLAETKTKLRWLCEEVRERDTREQRLRKQHRQTREQLGALRRSRDSEQAALLQRLDQQERLLQALGTEKEELLERSRRKEEETRSLQDRVLDMEMNTRAALDHLESIPEKQCLMENFRDLEESQQQREVVERRYSRHQEIVWDLQHQLDESKRRIQEYKDEKLDVASRSLRLAALSSSIKAPGELLGSPLTSDALSSPAQARRTAGAAPGARTPAD